MGVTKSILLIAYLALLLSDKTFINAALPYATSAGSACFYCLLIAQVKHKQCNAHRLAYAMHLPQHQRHSSTSSSSAPLSVSLSASPSVGIAENVIRVEALGGQLSSEATDIASSSSSAGGECELEVSGHACHEHDATIDYVESFLLQRACHGQACDGAVLCLLCKHSRATHTLIPHANICCLTLLLRSCSKGNPPPL